MMTGIDLHSLPCSVLLLCLTALQGERASLCLTVLLAIPDASSRTLCPSRATPQLPSRLRECAHTCLAGAARTCGVLSPRLPKPVAAHSVPPGNAAGELEGAVLNGPRTQGGRVGAAAASAGRWRRRTSSSRARSSSTWTLRTRTSRSQSSPLPPAQADTLRPGLCRRPLPSPRRQCTAAAGRSGRAGLAGAPTS